MNKGAFDEIKLRFSKKDMSFIPKDGKKRRRLLLILAVSFLLCGPLQALRPKLKEALYARKAPSLAGAAGLLVLLFFGLMRVTAGTYSAFIYFQF